MNFYGEMLNIIFLSLFVSLSAVFIAAIIGITLAVPIALHSFKGKKLIMRLSDSFMSTPPVFMGLVVYLILSRKGPLGHLGLLFTPTAMIIAQLLLVLPIIFGLSVSVIHRYGKEIYQNCTALGAPIKYRYLYIIKECRSQLAAVITAAFGRAISEVGAVMMVGGNIKGSTRVMTTFIALETGKGNFHGAILIGIVLISTAFIINFIFHRINKEGMDL
jgi:tungstate transport system permease protein